MEFKDDEQFYRVIKNTNPNAWDSENNKPSSAAFKDSRGCSVDGRYNRSEEDVLSFIHSNHDTSEAKVNVVVSVTKSICDERDIMIKSDPVENDPVLNDNPFHCILIRDNEKMEMTKSQCRHLANNSKIIELSSVEFQYK